MLRSARTAGRGRLKRGRAKMRADLGKLRRALGNPEAPTTVTQEPHDRDPRHLRRLVQLKNGDIPSVYDLGCYVEDITYRAVVQADLFLFMTPFMMEVWRKDLLGTGEPEYEGVIEWFYLASARRPLFRDLLGKSGERAVMAFMRDTILDPDRYGTRTRRSRYRHATE